MTDSRLFSPFVDGKGRPIELPRLAAPIADTHAHLDMLDDPVGALARAAIVGVGFIATVADVTEDAARTFLELGGWLADARTLLDEWGRGDLAVPEVVIVVGAHPHNAERYLSDPSYRETLRSYLADPRVAAIGEVGLDFHYDHSPRDDQRTAYREHLALAHEFGLPVVIHLREAHDEGLAILREVGMPSAGAILHCFNLGWEVAEPFIELGAHVSFAGPVTFKKSEDVRDSAVQAPRGRILTETDCPFMAPEPFRGRKCEPAFTAWTAERVAGLRAEGAEAFAADAYDAARALLRPRGSR